MRYTALLNSEKVFYETRDSFPILADTHCNSFDALFLLHHPVWKSYERRRRTFDRKCLIKNFKLGHSFSCQKIPQIYLVSILNQTLENIKSIFSCAKDESCLISQDDSSNTDFKYWYLHLNRFFALDSDFWTEDHLLLFCQTESHNLTQPRVS